MREFVFKSQVFDLRYALSVSVNVHTWRADIPVHEVNNGSARMCFCAAGQRPLVDVVAFLKICKKDRDSINGVDIYNKVHNQYRTI